MKLPLLAFTATTLLAASLRAEVKPNSLFADHAVLPRGVELPVWGTSTREGEPVTVEFAGQRASATAHEGKWQVRLRPLTAGGGPLSMTVRGDNVITLNDLLVGDVWLASGQSNMERQLGSRGGQKPIEGGEQAVAAANFPQIRQFYVPQAHAPAPVADAKGVWSVCTPATAPNFSAVGFFFARDLQPAVKVPVGMIHSSWGGTVAEAWTSPTGLASRPEFKGMADAAEAALKGGQMNFEELQNRWFEHWDHGSAKNTPGWQAPAVPATEGWQDAAVPVTFEALNRADFDGVLWFRRDVDLPPEWANRAAVLHLGAIDDQDTTWVNGTRVGSTDGYAARRDYRILAGTLHAGRNVLAVRLLDLAGPGGWLGKPEELRLETLPGEPALPPVPLAGPWRMREGFPLTVTNGDQFPHRTDSGQNTPAALYQAMIAPLQPFPIRGVIWYQGESNQDRARQYRDLFPALIADWRRAWGNANLPFLFVQIAPFNDMRPEIREAQLLTLRKTPNTAMVVTTDVGDANDIHPARKAPVGARLALAARAVAYGEKIEFSGPLFETTAVTGNRATLRFTHAADGLLASDNAPLRGFTIAGANGKFVPANAVVHGADTVEVFADAVPQPKAVRYGWANVPDVNLANREGLPASPFRTDVD